ncbi:hypothetical protein Pfeifenkraut_BL30040 [Xanthomonas phage Pfeifenkraut]|uniref:Uncharacterized protein n=1 Tax=Xanthomonas phage Pfeifenkraut TaxID=2939132 RepID=A0A9E7E140_9CAUD|nr:hypothetical protein QAY91_gp40 [Xanthomonas phage Pfeifenkraut]URA06937.1 hypothetical protein Pfeifenkraut_BL30040 [Xanthomonas phage Pfeifenkraut]
MIINAFAAAYLIACIVGIIVLKRRTAAKRKQQQRTNTPAQAFTGERAGHTRNHERQWRDNIIQLKRDRNHV